MAPGPRRDPRELFVTTSCVQSGAERFPDGDVPIIANGRNNLTALSSELDLYFVAELNEICVYRPWFPTQSLSGLLYKFTLPVSAPGLPGHIDRRHPHAVNALLIDKLGTKEVLVCACDDGDILLYYTRPLKDILAALQADAKYEGLLRPLVVKNVGRSAWGLAVHQNARMLAVSCNTHDITVFAFALTDDSVLYNRPETEWQYPGRSKDSSFILGPHDANIPNIAFFNSELDKEGRYLVSTDIEGLIIVWDLRERIGLKWISPRTSSIHQNPYSGWSVACLDPRSFLLTGTDADFLGCESEQDKCGTYDVTQSRLRVKGSSVHYPGPIPADPTTTDNRFPENIRQRVAEIRDNMLNTLQVRGQSVVDAREQAEILEQARHIDTVVTQQQQPDLVEQVGTGSDEDDEDMEDEDDADADLQDMDFDDDDNDDSLLRFGVNPPLISENNEFQPFRGFDWASRRPIEAPTRRQTRQVQITEPVSDPFSIGSDSEDVNEDSTMEEFDEHTESDLVSDGTLEQSWDFEPLTPSLVQEEVTRQSNVIKIMATDPADAPFLLLHTGLDFVSLQKAPFKDLAVISRDPCHQHLPPNMSWLLHLDRLHLTQTVPELNIIIVATATGRAAIYTLTRRMKTLRSVKKEEFGLRLDCIVPFSSQESLQQRPASFLIGIAAAPMQGHEIESGGSIPEQRWRLLLTYRDHTVLSYELWRNESASTLSYIH